MNVGNSQPCLIDSNIWLYRLIVNSADPDAIPKQQIATTITNYQNIFISTQVVNEVCANLIRKAGFNNAKIQILVEELAQGCEILPVSLETLQVAAKLRDRYLISFWDSLIVASAVLRGVSIIYSEDMQDSLIIENTLQIVNPFKGLNS